MLKSEEILNQLNEKLEAIKDLTGEEKVKMFEEIKNLKSDYQVEKELEKEEIKNIENIELKNEGEIINMRKSVELFNKITVEDRASVENIVKGIQNGMTAGDNGFLIPTTVSSTIIAKAEEVSKVYARCRKFNVSGNMLFAKAGSGVTVSYVEEGNAFPTVNPTLGNVKLEAFIAGALARISKSLIGRAGVDIVQYVVDELGKGLAKFLDRECLVGTEGKATGLVSTTNVVEVAKLDSDAFIDAQLEIDESIDGCVWVMNKNTLKKVRKFKGTDGQYILCQSLADGFKYQILGDGVVVDANMVDDQVIYGDLQAEYVKLAQDVQMQVLTEKYAEYHQIGVIGNVEMDAKLVEDDRVVLLKVAA